MKRKGTMNRKKNIMDIFGDLVSKRESVSSNARLELERMGRKLTVPFFKAWNRLSTRQKLEGINILSLTPYAVTARKAWEMFRNEDDPKIKASLVTLVGKTGNSKHIPDLAEALKSSDKRVRANAVEAIAALGGKEIINLLVPYLNDPCNRVKANTAKALWEFDEAKEMVRKVFEEMINDRSKWMKASAFYAFGETGILEFFNSLLDSLDESDEDIARNAVVALVGYAEKYEDKI